MSVNKDLRKKIIKKLIKIFKKDISSKIEYSIYKFSLDYSESTGTPFLIEQIYQDKSQTIICSLKNSKFLIKAINSGKIDASRISFLKPEELKPEKYDKIIKRKEVKRVKKKKKTTDAFECSKCKKRKCTVTEKQIMSGDEPATVFVTCVECGHAFSFS